MKEEKSKTKKTSMRTPLKESTTNKTKTEAAKEAIIKIIENTTPADYVEVQTRWLNVTHDAERKIVYSITVEKDGNLMISPKDRANLSMFDNEDF